MEEYFPAHFYEVPEGCDEKTIVAFTNSVPFSLSAFNSPTLECFRFYAAEGKWLVRTGVKWMLEQYMAANKKEE